MGEVRLFTPSQQLVFKGDTLELPWRDNDPVTSCYPPTLPGKPYQVLRRYSAAHGWHWHVLVPGRAVRLFHCGNYAASINPDSKKPDTKGCTLVGQGFQDITGDGQPELLNSAATMRRFMAVPINGFLLHVLAPPTLVT